MTSNRKDDHLALAAAQTVNSNHFDQLQFMHHALSGIDQSKVSIETQLFETSWALPFYLNGMTGGSEKTGEINRQLAIAAAETGLAMATGSMSILSRSPELSSTFSIARAENPKGFLMANLSVNASSDAIKEAVELIEANALQIHLNPMQEAIMPEGDRDFSGQLQKLERILAWAPVPVLVKEVGFGLSAQTLHLLAEIGISYADVSGKGGTNFAQIESNRRSDDRLSYLKNWGQSTVCSLLEAQEFTKLSDFKLLASGGVRNPLDVVKALSLGAKAVGVAGTFLKTVISSGSTGLVELIQSWNNEVKLIMAVLGAAKISELTSQELLISSEVKEFCELKGIDPSSFANRSSH